MEYLLILVIVNIIFLGLLVPLSKFLAVFTLRTILILGGASIFLGFSLPLALNLFHSTYVAPIYALAVISLAVVLGKSKPIFEDELSGARSVAEEPKGIVEELDNSSEEQESIIEAPGVLTKEPEGIVEELASSSEEQECIIKAPEVITEEPVCLAEEEVIIIGPEIEVEIPDVKSLTVMDDEYGVIAMEETCAVEVVPLTDANHTSMEEAVEVPVPLEEDDILTIIEAGFTARAQGNPALAMSIFTRGMKLNPDPRLAMLLFKEVSDLYKEIGQYYLAAAALRTLVESGSGLKPGELRYLQEQADYLEEMLKNQ